MSAFKDRTGHWQLQVSAGGLVSALMGVANIETKWIGWPGARAGGRVAWAGRSVNGVLAAVVREGEVAAAA